jgi:hypothetical protein
MKTRHSAPFSAALALLSGVCLADTFQLKDGSTLEGRILKEDDTSYHVEVQVTKSIKDERTIAKADVRSIEREQPDAKAFEAIEKLMPAPDLLTASDYEARIKSVEKFLTDHRGSSRAPAAKVMLEKLKAEANEILAGGIKMNGKIIPSTEYLANAYEIDARVMEARFRTLIKEARYLEALRVFNEMSRDFRNTDAYREVLPLATQAINTYLAEVTQVAAGFDERMRQRQVGLSRMTPDDRATTEAAIKEETAELEARLKAEKDAKVGWVTTSPDLKASLDETLTFGKQELNRLSSFKSATPVDGGKAYRDALRLIHTGSDKNAMTTAISAAKSAQIPQKYIANLEAAAAAK